MDEYESMTIRLVIAFTWLLNIVVFMSSAIFLVFVPSTFGKMLDDMVRF